MHSVARAAGRNPVDNDNTIRHLSGRLVPPEAWRRGKRSRVAFRLRLDYGQGGEMPSDELSSPPRKGSVCAFAVKAEKD